MNLKVKDFAKLRGVSESIIYRHIRQHREELGDNIIKKAKATWITDAGQEYIIGLMVQEPPATVLDRQTSSELHDVLEQLALAKAENEQLRTLGKAQQEQFIALSTAYNSIVAENAQLKGVQLKLDASETEKAQLRQERDAAAERAANEQAAREAAEERCREQAVENDRIKNLSVLAFWKEKRKK